MKKIIKPFVILVGALLGIWPWVTTLTSGEVAIAPLKWEPY